MWKEQSKPDSCYPNNHFYKSPLFFTKSVILSVNSYNSLYPALNSYHITFILYLSLTVLIFFLASALLNLLKMAQKLKPTDFGGYGRRAGPYGGLKGMEFSSRCPPAIKPRTRIIGVCGINDYLNASSPSSDGWFHSDFYLFHYLFSGTGESLLTSIPC